MTALEQVTAAIRESDRLDAGTRDLLLQFVAASSPILASLEAETLRTLLSWLAGGSAQLAPPPEAIARLDSAQVLALLDLTQAQMDALVDQRRAELLAARAAVQQLGQAALAILARFLIAAL